MSRQWIWKSEARPSNKHMRVPRILIDHHAPARKPRSTRYFDSHLAPASMSLIQPAKVPISLSRHKETCAHEAHHIWEIRLRFWSFTITAPVCEFGHCIKPRKVRLATQARLPHDDL